MRRSLSLARAIAAGALLILCGSAAPVQALDLYRVEITPLLHEGDPAPGVPNATVAVFLPPQIDAAGDVLVSIWMLGSGVTSKTNFVILYGRPGEWVRVVREGDQAPDLPGGVVFSEGLGAGINGYVSENGLVVINGELEGPGVIPDVNDEAVFYGPPNDLHLVLRAGDPAPETEPGTVFKGVVCFGAMINDVGGLLLCSGLAGPAIDPSKDQARWVGMPGDLRLVWRKGMPAPGTEPGVVFAWSDYPFFNDMNWLSVRCGLAQLSQISDRNGVGGAVRAVSTP